MQSVPFSTDYLASLEPDGYSLRVFDPECPGLGVYVSADGMTRVYFAYRWEDGMDEPVEVEIGSVSGLSVEQARSRTREIVAMLTQGRQFPAIRQSMGTARLMALYGAPVEAGHQGNEFRHPGECQKCQDMTLLNGAGLCSKCRPLPPCSEHPELASVARCGSCSQPFCQDCMDGRRCVSCEANHQANARARRKGAAPAAFEKAPKKKGQKSEGGIIARIKADPKKALIPLVGVLVLVQGGLMAWTAYDSFDPTVTPEQHYEQRLGLATSGVSAFREAKKSLPNDAAALATFLKAQGSPPVTLSSQTSPLPKDAVVYVKKGDTFELYATTSDGTRFTPEGGKSRVAPAD